MNNKHHALGAAAPTRGRAQAQKLYLVKVGLTSHDAQGSTAPPGVVNWNQEVGRTVNMHTDYSSQPDSIPCLFYMFKRLQTAFVAFGVLEVSESLQLRDD